MFEREAARLRSILGERVLALEHVRSTAVRGLSADPAIDIDGCVHDVAYLSSLAAAGYRLVIRGPDWHEHRLFNGPDTDVNVHLWTLGSPEARRHVLFRDHLRSNADDRRRYGELEEILARRDFRYVFENNNVEALLIR